MYKNGIVNSIFISELFQAIILVKTCEWLPKLPRGAT